MLTHKKAAVPVDPQGCSAVVAVRHDGVIGEADPTDRRERSASPACSLSLPPAFNRENNGQYSSFGDEEGWTMFSRKRLVTALGVVVLGLATTASIGAGVHDNDTMYVSFNRPVALPGVSLGSGTYVFERLDMHAHSVVRVLSRDRKIVHFTAFTHAVDRPAGLKRDQVISFAEPSPNVPQQIAIWWPEDSPGRQFIYPEK
jgi:hypothetical protein